jgi:hypothetical protein
VESESLARRTDSLMSRLLRWLATDRGNAKRYPLPGLVAYYWTSGTPKACSVGNISSTGMYVFTDERWLPGSVIPMTLQGVSATEQDPEDWIAVLTLVVRSGPDGRGLAFVFSRSTNLFGDEIPPERVADKKALKRFLKHLKLP